MVLTIIGIMGPGEAASSAEVALAYQVGYQIAQAGWVVLTGGRPVGVMEAATRGAKAADGLTVGIVPTNTRDTSASVDLAIVTGLGQARNAINALSSHIVIACGMGLGTAAEVALALKSDIPVILLRPSLESLAFFRTLAPDHLIVLQTVDDVVPTIQALLD